MTKNELVWIAYYRMMPGRPKRRETHIKALNFIATYRVFWDEVDLLYYVIERELLRKETKE